MKCYFHADANIYRNRVRTFLEYAAVPVVFLAVFMSVCLLLSLRNLMTGGLLVPVLTGICTVLFVFTLLARILIGIAEFRVRVHSKYTYIEIAKREIIVSVYAGTVPGFGTKTLLRRVVVIPFRGLVDVQMSKSGKILLKMSENAEKSELIRDYTGNSDRLGYCFKDDKFSFTEFFYNERGYKSLREVFIPPRFVNNEDIINSILEAKSRFNELPSEKIHVFEEMSFVKTRRIRKLAKEIRKN